MIGFAVHRDVELDGRQMQFARPRPVPWSRRRFERFRDQVAFFTRFEEVPGDGGKQREGQLIFNR